MPFIIIGEDKDSNPVRVAGVFCESKSVPKENMIFRYAVSGVK
jgi:hypothetical protein